MNDLNFFCCRDSVNTYAGREEVGCTWSKWDVHRTFTLDGVASFRDFRDSRDDGLSIISVYTKRRLRIKWSRPSRTQLEHSTNVVHRTRTHDRVPTKPKPIRYPPRHLLVLTSHQNIDPKFHLQIRPKDKDIRSLHLKICDWT